MLELDDPELNSSLVFVGKGCLSVLYQSREKKSLRTCKIQQIKQGQAFGYYEFFTGEKLWFSLQSSEFSNLQIIKRSEFLEVLA